jgi:hypothetical protein
VPEELRTALAAADGVVEVSIISRAD